MLFTKLAVAAGLFASSALALSPATRMERHQRSLAQRTEVDAASVSSTLSEVKTNIETIGSDLAGKLAALPTQTVTDVAGLVIPAVQAITAEVNTAVSTVTSAAASGLDLSNSLDKIAADLVAIVNAVLAALKPVEQLLADLPLLGPLLLPVLSILNMVLGLLLSKVSMLLPGVLDLVHKLLDNVAGLLTALGLGNVVSLLGL